jgi:hypothetical protein
MRPTISVLRPYASYYRPYDPYYRPYAYYGVPTTNRGPGLKDAKGARFGWRPLVYARFLLPAGFD